MRRTSARTGYGLVLGTGFAIGLMLAAFPIDVRSRWHDDAALRSRVDASLALHRALMPFDIQVAARNGRVQLSGSVDDALERELATRLAQAIDGVRGVDNRLTVEPDRARWRGTHTAMAGLGHGDASLALAVRAQLRWHRATRALPIEVDSVGGVVVLHGKAPDQRLRRAAGRIAARTRNVLAVENRITVQPASDFNRAQSGVAAALADNWLRLRVRSALLFASNVDGLDLEVSVRDQVVMLKGMVANRTELDLVTEIAAAVAGVRWVDTAQVRISV